MSDLTPIFPLKVAQVALTGATHATLVAAPPAGVAYHILRVYGTNGSGAARTLSLHLNNNTTVTTLWQSAATNDAIPFTGAAGAQPPLFDIYLTTPTQSLEMDLDDTGTATIVAFYEVHEARFV